MSAAVSEMVKEMKDAFYCCGRAIIDHKNKNGAWCEACKKITKERF